jgi:putative ABC transport system permease protein
MPEFAAKTGFTTGASLTLTVNDKPIRVKIAGEVFIPNGIPSVFAGWQTLGGTAAGLTTNQYDIDLTSGASVQTYSDGLQRALPSGIGVGMATRERVHDLGVFKAVGMTPRQTIAMVICWVIPPAVIATAIALPSGLTAQDLLVYQLASLPNSGSVDTVLPASFVHVLDATDLLLLALAGLAIAVAGALGPAIWAARTRTAAVLHTE